MSRSIPSCFVPAALVLLAAGCQSSGEPSDPSTPHATGSSLEIHAGRPVDPLPGETHLRNIRQLTFGGENAEAYWSFDGSKLIFQSARPPAIPGDQIFVLDLATGEEHMVSTGRGKTTCSYFLKGDQEIIYASTHLGGDAPPHGEHVIDGKYVWAIFDSYDIFRAHADGSHLVRLTDTPGYDAEATVDPVTGRLVFTSLRDGDLELYTMAADGSDVKRVTNRHGYDGGAFYSHDGSKLVLRSGFFADQAEADLYDDLLQRGYVMPTKMEITVCKPDGSDFRQVTHNGKANFAPYWHPDDQRILFSSNQDDPRGRNFEIYMIKEDGSGQEQVTHNPSFDGFPMFSPDGKFLVFASNRHGGKEGETNLFVAEWVENP